MKKVMTLLFATLFTITIFQIGANAESPKDRPVEDKLAKMAHDFSTQMTPEMLKAGQQGLDELKKHEVLKTALKIGNKIPKFMLPDANGNMIKSSDLLKDSTIVLVFYRGAWCPYCNLYLSELDDYLGKFNSLGASLVAVSPEPVDRSLEVVQKDSLTYTVLSDVGMTAARKFGLVYELPEVTNNFLIGFGLNIAEYNNTDKAELPLSATYVINKDGIIIYSFIEADYKLRAEPADILTALTK